MLFKLEKNLPQIENSSFIAPNSVIIGNVIIGSRSSVWFGALIRGDKEKIEIGNNSNIQDLSVLHTDPGVTLKIGDNVTVGHKATIHGCTIGDNTLIGINSVILNNAKIGKNCIIGAGAIITENAIIPDNSLVIGIPGKVKREILEKDVELIIKSANDYYEKSLYYKLNLKMLG